MNNDLVKINSKMNTKAEHLGSQRDFNVKGGESLTNILVVNPQN